MFKRNANKTADLAKQLAELGGTNKFEKDPTEWAVTTDKAGNGSATIRFLPAKGENGEVVPFVKMYSHSFKDEKTGKWYIENCATTIGGSYDDCPVCSRNNALFESGKLGNKADEKLAQLRSRKLSYWANIVVIKDENNPSAQGKVFKFRFGKKIFEKIAAIADSKIEEIPSVDVTDVFDGANFYLKVKKVSGFPNYDDSTFGPVSELFGGDEEKLKEVWAAMHPLMHIASPDKFKTPEALQQQFDRATGGSKPAVRRETPMEREVREAREENPPIIADNTKDDGLDDIPFDNPAPTSKSTDSGADVDDIEAFLASLN